jgi:nucleoside-diphosphate-sugar epimerase
VACAAVIVASGANDKADPLGPFNVDYNGNLNLIAAAKAAGVKHFVLVTSIGTDDILNPLNLFWGVSLGGPGLYQWC